MSYDKEGFPTRANSVPNPFRTHRHYQEGVLINSLVHDEQDAALEILTQMNKEGWEMSLNIVRAIVSHDDYARQLISKEYLGQVIDVRYLLITNADMFIRALCQTDLQHATQKNLFRFFLKYTSLDLEDIVRDVLKIPRQRAREFGLRALLQEKDTVFNTQKYKTYIDSEKDDKVFNFHFWSRNEVGDNHRIGDILIDSFRSDIHRQKQDIFSLFEKKYFRLFDVYNEEISGEDYISLSSLYQLFLNHVDFADATVISKVSDMYKRTLLASCSPREYAISQKVNALADAMKITKPTDLTNRLIYHVMYHRYKINNNEFQLMVAVLKYISNYEKLFGAQMLTSNEVLSGVSTTFEEKAYFYAVNRIYGYITDLEAILDDLHPVVTYHTSSILYERSKSDGVLPPPAICYHVAHYQLMNFDLTITERTTSLSILNEAGTYRGANVLFQKILIEQAGLPFGFTFNQEIKVDIETILMLLQRIAEHKS